MFSYGGNQVSDRAYCLNWDKKAERKPRNMVSASAPTPVFMKYANSWPSLDAVNLYVDAKLDPPWATIFELVASKPKASRIAGSTFGCMAVFKGKLVSKVDEDRRSCR
jgi:hypothetical protein